MNFAFKKFIVMWKNDDKRVKSSFRWGLATHKLFISNLSGLLLLVIPVCFTSLNTLMFL